MLVLFMDNPSVNTCSLMYAVTLYNMLIGVMKPVLLLIKNCVKAT